jgi:hypothetical protein
MPELDANSINMERNLARPGKRHYAGSGKWKAPARLPGGRNSDCGFSPIPFGAGRQKKSLSRLMIARFT